MTVWAWAGLALAAAVVLVLYCCVCINQTGGKQARKVRQTVARALLAVVVLAIMAAVLTAAFGDKITMVQVTRDSSLPESWKAWLWGWR